MMVRSTLSLAGLLTVAGIGYSAPPMILPVLTGSILEFVAPPIPDDQIRAAVKGLASSDYEVREKAQANIVLMGEKAVPQLRRAQNNLPDAEARKRLSVILQKLDLDRLTTARKVTLVAERITAPQSLRQICRQAGYRFRGDGLGEQLEQRNRYDFNIKGRPFWEAVDTICNASGIGIQVEEDGTILALNHDAYNPLIAYSGPFRFVANQISSNRYLQLGGLSRQTLPTSNPDNLGVNLTVFAEPKTTLVATRGPWVTKLIDETGKTIPQSPFDASQSYYGGNGYRAFAQNLHLPFFKPAKDATLLKEIRAKATLIVLTDMKSDVVISDLLKSKGRKVAGRSASIEVQDAVEANGTVTINATITNPHGNPNDYQWVNSIWQRIEVTDAKGEKYQVNVQNTNYQNAQTVSFSLLALPPDGIKCGPAATMTLVEWVTRSVEVEFSFKNVPLP